MSPIASHATGPPDPAVTALQGASLAFNKKKPAPPPPKNDKGARTAATSAGRPRSPIKQLGHQSTGGSVADVEHHGGLNALRSQQLGASLGQLYPGHGSTKADPKSASFIAATLAASRSASPTPKARTPRRKLSVGAASSSSGEVVDSGPIAATGSLISMFEQARAGDPFKRASPRRSPVRTPVGSSESIAEASEPETQPTPSRAPAANPKLKPKVKPKPRPLTPPPQPIARSGPAVLSPKPQKPATKPQLKPVLRPATPPQIMYRAPTQVWSPPAPSPDPPKRSPQPARQRPPTPPQPRGTNKPALQSKTPGKQKAPAVEPRMSRPNLASPLVPARRDRRPSTADTVSSDDTFVSASSTQSPKRRPSPRRPSSHKKPTLSMPPSPTQRATPRPNPKSSSTSSLPLESLTNAIMASSLASARLTPHNTGGSLAPPAVPRRQKSPRMMQTLRQPPKEVEEESDRHKKGHLHKLHSGKKHSHHEGSRKRWREEITPRERKRYEAVWASNRGLLLDLPNSPVLAISNGEVSEYVINVIVRQIWRRSRLPIDELAEVWDLVDRQGRGILGRQEFVVGMWLIDQRLRGRKIPAKVSESVWGSAVGMKVTAPKVK